MGLVRDQDATANGERPPIVEPAALPLAAVALPSAAAPDGLIVVEPTSIDRDRGSIRVTEEDRGANRDTSAQAVAAVGPGPAGAADSLIMRENGAGDVYYGRVRGRVIRRSERGVQAAPDASTTWTRRCRLRHLWRHCRRASSC